MTTMAEKLREAGVDTDSARLRSACENALRRAGLNEGGALRRFIAALRDDRALLEALASQYLRQIAADMRGPNSEGASRLSADSLMSDDRLSPSLSSGRSSLNPSDSHRRVPAPTKISRAAAIAVATSVYDRRIGPSDVSFRTATLFDIVNAERAGSRYTRAMSLLRTRKAWPEGATLPSVYTEAELASILDEAAQAMPPIPLEVAHGR